MGAWHYQVGGTQKGPVSSDELVRLFQAGALDSESMICTSGSSEWLRAAQVVGLPDGCLGTVTRSHPNDQVPPPPPPPPSTASGFSEAASTAVEDGLSLLIPMRVEPFALVAGYLALFVPIGVILLAVREMPRANMAGRLCFLPVAASVCLSLISLKRLRGKQAYRGEGRAWFAITLGFLGLLLMLLIVRSKG